MSRREPASLWEVFRQRPMKGNVSARNIPRELAWHHGPGQDQVANYGFVVPDVAPTAAGTTALAGLRRPKTME